MNNRFLNNNTSNNDTTNEIPDKEEILDIIRNMSCDTNTNSYRYINAYEKNTLAKSVLNDDYETFKNRLLYYKYSPKDIETVESSHNNYYRLTDLLHMGMVADKYDVCELIIEFIISNNINVDFYEYTYTNLFNFVMVIYTDMKLKIFRHLLNKDIIQIDKIDLFNTDRGIEIIILSLIHLKSSLFFDFIMTFKINTYGFTKLINSIFNQYNSHIEVEDPYMFKKNLEDLLKKIIYNYDYVIDDNLLNNYDNNN